MLSPRVVTYISSSMATTVAQALLEAGLESAQRTFAAAVTWPVAPHASPELPITVTPEVTSAMLDAVNAGQLTAFIDSGVSAQEILMQAHDWLADLNGASRATDQR